MKTATKESTGAHRVTRRLPNGVLRYQPVAGGSVEFEKGDVAVYVLDGRFRLFGAADSIRLLPLANAGDLIACLTAAANEESALPPTLPTPKIRKDLISK